MNNFVPAIAVDVSGGIYDGHVYVAWQVLISGNYDIYVIRSVDDGNTWSAVDRRQVDTRGYIATNPRIAVDIDGWVYVSFQDLGNGNFDIFVARSSDGGATWLPEVQVSSSTDNEAYASVAAMNGLVCAAWQETSLSSLNLWSACSASNGNNWNLGNIVTNTIGQGNAVFVSITIDTAGTAHAAWNATDSTGRIWVAYSQSADQGNTWSNPIQVNDNPTTSSFYVTNVDITQFSGVLYVVWADNRNFDLDIFSSWSEDNGAMWGDGLLNNNDVRVDDTDANVNPLDDASDQSFPSIAHSSFGVYVIWTDKRDAVAYHAYFSSFEVSEILITEVRDSPDGMEEVELFNHGGKSIDLTGWGLYVDGVRVDLFQIGNVLAGTYVTVGDRPTCTLPIDITLGDEGGSVLLRNQLNALKDAVYYGQQGIAPDPVSGESVERAPSGGGYSNSWTRQPSPTFGAANNRPLPASNPPVVLNEVLFNTAIPNDRFVELFLRGLGTVNLTGFILVGDVAYSLPSVLLSIANPFYVIRPVSAPGVFNLMDIAGDNLYLYDSAGVLYDMVGWSSAHNQTMSMVRIPDGVGTYDGFNDTTSYAAGWRFNQVPSLPLVLIGPKQTKGGDLGTRVFYVLSVTNKEPIPSYVNIQMTPGFQSWTTALFKADGVTPLPDSPGDADAVPDTGLLAPEEQTNIQAAVDIPPSPQVQDWETVIVTAIVADDPFASASTTVTTNIFPYESPAAVADPTTIYVDMSPPAYVPKRSTLSLSVTGRGTSMFHQRPQDTMFIIDGTGSMVFNDPTSLRLAAAKHYVDLLSVPDRAAVVQFSALTATLVNGHHLSSDYATIKNDIDTIGSVGGTNLLLPLRLATNEIINNGNLSHVWVEIFLTDGDDTAGNSDASILAEAQRAANNGIVIFTIGLVGSGAFDEALLQQIAAMTGGIYLRAQTASDLDAIYQLIGQIVKNLAGYDNDVTDDIPMISVDLPSYISVVPGTVNPAPDFTAQYAGVTNLQWNLSKLSINETWTASLQVTSSMSGMGLDAIVYPSSRVSYIRYDDTRIEIPFPRTHIDVLAPPPPPPKPVNYTITRNPLFGNVTVDGVDYPAPATFSWLPGEMHNISAPDVDTLSPGERWLFVAWNDSGSRSHMIVVINATITITASYTQQFRPAVILQGLDALHSVTARFTSWGVQVAQAGTYGTWSEWVDATTALSFDMMGTGSNFTERWITSETFTVPPWTFVDSPFQRTIVYWHQVRPAVELQGLDSVHGVAAHLVFMGIPANQPNWYGTWSEWLDFSSALSFDTLGAGSSSVERWFTRETFSSPPWTAVDSAFQRTVLYWHQVMSAVVLQGLDDPVTVPIQYVKFGTQEARSSNAAWSDWTDYGSLFRVGGQVLIPPSERYLNLVQMTATYLEYVATSPSQHVIPFLHQFKPLVYVLRTDVNHTVDVLYRDTSSGQTISFDTGLYGSWSDWADRGSTIDFSDQTTGDVPRKAMNETVFSVTSAFVGYIVYMPPPPANPEPNYKPLISLAFVVMLVASGLYWGNRKPLDLYIPPANPKMSKEDRKKRNLELRKTPIEEKFQVFTLLELEKKFDHDRRFTMSMLAIPIAAIEGSIGVASYVTGVFRVPEVGNWLSIGLFANSVILMTGLVLDYVVQRKGYKIPSEEELAEMKTPGQIEKGSPARGKKSGSMDASRAPAADKKPNKDHD